MSKRGIVAAAATALTVLTLGAAPVRAQSYNNGIPNGVNGNEMTEWIQAEDFAFGSASTLTSVRFWASIGTPGYTGSINWQIYSNSANAPGSVLFSGLATPTATLYPGADIPGVLTGYQFDFALPSINLAAGTYWLGLHNGPLTTTARDEMYWATTNGNTTTLGMEDITPFGDGWVGTTQEHAFQLNATQTSVTPEPETMALMATGLVGLTGGGMFRRRRKTV